MNIIFISNKKIYRYYNNVVTELYDIIDKNLIDIYKLKNNTWILVDSSGLIYYKEKLIDNNWNIIRNLYPIIEQRYKITEGVYNSKTHYTTNSIICPLYGHNETFTLNFCFNIVENIDQNIDLITFNKPGYPNLTILNNFSSIKPTLNNIQSNEYYQLQTPLYYFSYKINTWIFCSLTVYEININGVTYKKFRMSTCALNKDVNSMITNEINIPLNSSYSYELPTISLYNNNQKEVLIKNINFYNYNNLEGTVNNFNIEKSLMNNLNPLMIINSSLITYPKIISISQLYDADRSILGISDQSNMYTKKDKNSPWILKSNCSQICNNMKIDVNSVGNLIGNKNSEFYSLNTGINLNSLNGTWEKINIPNKSIKKLRNKDDGTILVVDSTGKLFELDNTAWISININQYIITSFCVLTDGEYTIQDDLGYYCYVSSLNNINCDSNKYIPSHNFKITDNIDTYSIQTLSNKYCSPTNCTNSSMGDGEKFDIIYDNDNRSYNIYNNNNNCYTDYTDKFVCNSNQINNSMKKFNISIVYNANKVPLTSCEQALKAVDEIQIRNDALRLEALARYNEAKQISDKIVNEYSSKLNAIIAYRDEAGRASFYEDQTDPEKRFIVIPENGKNVLKKCFPDGTWDEAKASCCYSFPKQVQLCCACGKYNSNHPCNQCAGSGCGPGIDVPNKCNLTLTDNPRQAWYYQEVQKLNKEREDALKNTEFFRIAKDNVFQFDVPDITCCQSNVISDNVFNVGGNVLFNKVTNECTTINNNNNDDKDEDEDNNNDLQKFINFFKEDTPERNGTISGIVIFFVLIILIIIIIKVKNNN